jgi:hypothetical protein
MECEQCGALFENTTSFIGVCCSVCAPETKIEKTKKNNGKVFMHLLGEFNTRYSPMIHDILSSTEDPNEITVKMSNVIFSDVASRVENLIHRCDSLYDVYLALKIENRTTDINISTRNPLNDFVCDMV